MPLWVIRVCEVNPPAGVQPLEWILLTNRKLATLEDAWECASWYECRWVIELFHPHYPSSVSLYDGRRVA